MLEQKGNLWDLAINNILCITTNGFIKSNGECVMGRGIAKEAAIRYPSIPRKLGTLLGNSSNKVTMLGTYDSYQLISFPVKDSFENFEGNNVVSHMKNKFKSGDIVPGWACLARIDIIERSTRELINLVNSNQIFNNKLIYLPRLGCGAGELSWTTVKEIIKPILDDRFIVCTF